MTDLLSSLLDQPPWLILTVSGLIVFGECALLVGMVLPGETVAVLAGAAAALGRTSLVSVLVVVLLAALVGDSVGYVVGRRVGASAWPAPRPGCGCAAGGRWCSAAGRPSCAR